MSTYVDVADYIASPRSADPVILLAEARIRTRYLCRLLDERDAELADRERLIGELVADIR